MDKIYLLIFENTHKAIHAENVLKQKKIEATVVPTPTSITKSCGISIKINSTNIDDVEKLIRNKEITIKSIYVKMENQYEVFNLEN